MVNGGVLWLVLLTKNILDTCCYIELVVISLVPYFIFNLK